MLLTSELIGYYGLIRGGLLQLPVNQCYFIILKTSLISIIESSLLAQYLLLALQTILQRLQANLSKRSFLFSQAAILYSKSHQGQPIFQPIIRVADLEKALLTASIRLIAVKSSSSIEGISISNRLRASVTYSLFIKISLLIISSQRRLISSIPQVLQLIIIRRGK